MLAPSMGGPGLLPGRGLCLTHRERSYREQVAKAQAGGGEAYDSHGGVTTFVGRLRCGFTGLLKLDRIDINRRR